MVEGGKKSIFQYFLSVIPHFSYKCEETPKLPEEIQVISDKSVREKMKKRRKRRGKSKKVAILFCSIFLALTSILS